MYFKNSPRTYVLTNQEIKNGIVKCPKCCSILSIVPNMKIDKLYRCDSCGFHIPKSKVLDCRDKLVREIVKVASLIHLIKEEVKGNEA